MLCCWEMTSVMVLDEVTLQIHVSECDLVYVLAGVLQCNGGKLEEAKDFKCVCVRIEVDQL